MKRIKYKKNKYGLTDREMEVVGLFEVGYTLAEISKVLDLQQSTLWRYAAVIREKTHSKTTTEAVIKVLRARGMHL